MTEHGSLIDRREFMGRTLAAGAAAAALPAVSWARTRGANDRVRVGVIGCGPQGQAIARQLLRRAETDLVGVGRVCDLYRPRLEASAKLLALPAEMATMEYRDVLDDPDVDAVVVATPDHWHAKVTIEALQAGKSVLVETPLTHTIEQASAVRDAAQRSRAVLAVAAQRCSDDRYWVAREAIAHDRIGRVTWSQGAFCLNGRIPIFNRPYDRAPSPDADSPDYLWWDRWLGHEWGLAPKTEFSAERFFQYQKFYDYANGMAGELLFGVLAPILLAVGAADEPPRRVVCGGGRYNYLDSREIPDQMMAVLDYASEQSVVLVACATNSLGLDTTFRGRHGAAILSEEGVSFREEAAFYPEFRGSNKDHVDAGMSKDARGRWIPDPPAGEVGFALERGERADAVGNFLASVRGEATPHCGVELAFNTMIAVGMISRAIRDQCTVFWDRERERLADE